MLRELSSSFSITPFLLLDIAYFAFTLGQSRCFPLGDFDSISFEFDSTGDVVPLPLSKTVGKDARKEESKARLAPPA